ncbi:DUF1573 domain-containing protein [Reichenbachiella sp. MALMAid0571]|uniref:DUF1573 domain-containing protein n=1 Tax=Reichenbachiella sp. MALMAid0571 TaxID=3143939 RepID=UPI0032DEF1DA
MKKTILLFLFTFICMSTHGQSRSSESGKKAKITFDETSHDFGDIKQGDQVSYTFSFKNTGEESLVISKVRTTCGCTAPYWPKEPIAPGKTDKIKITFNSKGKMGHQHKVITVESNAVNNPETVSITANILPATTTK